MSGTARTLTLAAVSLWAALAGWGQAPTISQLSPDSATAYSGSVALTVQGSGFKPDAVVVFNGQTLTPSTAATPTSIQVTVPATALETGVATAVTRNVFVRNVGDALDSSALTFTINPAPAPTISLLTPNSASAGAAATPLTVTGTNFLPGAVIVFAGADLTPTEFLSPTSLSATIPSNLLAADGSAAVTVRNPDTRVSDPAAFTIAAQAPTISQLSPDSATAYSGSVALTVQGSGFKPDAVVVFNGQTLTPSTPATPTSIQVTVPATALETGVATAVTRNVFVRNVGDALDSSALTFTINPAPAPTISLLTPNSASAGAAATPLTVTGTNFLPGAVIVFAGTDLTPTAFGSSTSLSATIPSNLLATAGPVNVTVRNPDTQVSDPAAFTITLPPLTITPNPPTPPAGTVGVPYGGISFTAAGGVGPYTITILEDTSSLAAVGLTFNPASPTAGITGTPTASGSVTFRIRATDSTPDTPMEVTSSAFTLTIGNPPLTIVTDSPLAPATAGTAYSVAIAGAGGDGLQYTWSLAPGSSFPLGLSLGSTSGAQTSLLGTPRAAGTFTFTLELNDNDPNTTLASKQFAITVVPVITSLNPASRNAGNADLPLQIFGFGFVGGSTSVTFGTTQIASTGVGISGGSESNPVTVATLTVPGAALANPDPSVPVTVSVGGVVSNQESFTVIGDTTLNITNDSNLGATTAGIAYSADLDATGGNGTYTWSVNSGNTLPPGITLNPSTGVLSGTPTQAGTFTFTIGVVDSLSPPLQSSGQKSFTLVVENFVVSTTTLPQARVGIAYSTQLALSGGPTPTPGDYQWTLVSPASSLPPGLSFDAATGRISGTPSPIGSPSQTFSIQVSARHTPTGLTTPNRTLSITVTGGGLDISLNALPVATVLEAYGPGGQGVTITPVNGSPTYTISLTSTSRDQLEAAGFAVSTAQQNTPNASLTIASRRDLSGNVAGPTISGTLTAVVEVRDAANTQVQRTLSLLVLPESLRILPETLPSAALNVPYLQQLTLSGVSAQEQNVPQGQPAVTWSIVTPVPGLSINTATGQLSGTFTTAGPRQFTVVARTSLRETSRILSFSVEALKPVISTSTLPVAIVGQIYSASIEATGGTPGYTWQVAGITLPAGLSFDAGSVTTATLSIAGTAGSAAQTRTFQITVRDSAGETATREFTINVNAAPIPAISIQPFPNPAPAEQKDVVVSLAQTYPVALSGTVTLSFTPNATNNADDPQVQFVTGGRTAHFTIPANETQAVFSGVSAQRVQTGTVAGAVRVEAAIDGGGPSTLQEFSIARSAPFIQDSLTLQSTSGGFNVVLTGYSTARDLTNLQITFTPTSGTNLGTTQLTVPLTDAATQWFQSAPGQQNGSAFKLTVPFNVQNGTNAVSAVTVTLTGSAGTSNSRTRSF